MNPYAPPEATPAAPAARSWRDHLSQSAAYTSLVFTCLCAASIYLSTQWQGRPVGDVKAWIHFWLRAAILTCVLGVLFAGVAVLLRRTRTSLIAMTLALLPLALPPFIILNRLLNGP